LEKGARRKPGGSGAPFYFCMGARQPACIVVAVAAILSGACVGGPLPIVIHEERDLSVWLKFDPVSGAGHRHPAEISAEQMGAVLTGLRTVSRGAIGSLFDGEQEGDRVFGPAEVARLSPLLSQAFRKASPRDMVTFYVVNGEKGAGPLITSGGLVARNGFLYVILANARTSPHTRLYETSHEVDTREDPVLPLARFNFLVKFDPASAEVPKGQARDSEAAERYVDPAKIVVIDLAKLPARQGRGPAGLAPSIGGR
jgi:hypothetical protein